MAQIYKRSEQEERAALIQWLRAHLQHNHFSKEPRLEQMSLEELQQLHRGIQHGENR